MTTDKTVWVWGLPLAPLTMERTLDEIDRAIAARAPSYFITANLYYAMVTDENADLPAINERAAFVLADGMPLVWAARGRLPERVTGSDLIFRICERAAARGHRLYFLGGAPGVGDEAAAKLRARYPGVQIVGIEAPDMGALTADDTAALLCRVREAKTDLLFVALGQPKGERWMAAHIEALGVPLCVQVGATLDFVAGRVKRAPRWMQKTCVEWVFRMLQEPRRLGPRYLRSIGFLFKMVARDLTGRARKPHTPPPSSSSSSSNS